MSPHPTKICLKMKMMRISILLQEHRSRVRKSFSREDPNGSQLIEENKLRLPCALNATNRVLEEQLPFAQGENKKMKKKKALYID